MSPNSNLKPLGDGRRLPEDAIQPGAEAVLIGPASVAVARKVRLLCQEDVPQTIDQGSAPKAGAQAVQGNGCVEVAGDESQPLHYILPLA